jgi:transposase
MARTRRSAQSVSISTFEQSFPDEESCRAHLFYHSAGLSHRCAGRNAAPRMRPALAHATYWCPLCRRTESARARTIFRSTNIPVRKIFYAMLLMADLPGNTSVGFLSRQLGITRKSAGGLGNKIRLHMAALERPRTIGGWGQPVWIDETFIRLRGERPSTCIFGMKDEANLSLHIVPDRRALTLHTLIEETVVSGSVLITDDFSSYRGLERLGWKHHRLNHSKRMWSDDEGRSTASIDLVWRWLKRDLAGRTGQIAQEDLWKYIKQFLFKFHAQSHPAEAYWRLVSTYPPPERYVEETFRREVDCRWRWPRAAAGLPASEDASRWDWRPRRPTRRKSGD